MKYLCVWFGPHSLSILGRLKVGDSRYPNEQNIARICDRKAAKEPLWDKNAYTLKNFHELFNLLNVGTLKLERPGNMGHFAC